MVAYGCEKPDVSEDNGIAMDAAQLSAGRYCKKCSDPEFATPPESGIVKFTSRPKIFAGR
jgi:hypothetical protein